jgi:hypothetical protein
MPAKRIAAMGRSYTCFIPIFIVGARHKRRGRLVPLPRIRSVAPRIAGMELRVPPVPARNCCIQQVTAA